MLDIVFIGQALVHTGFYLSKSLLILCLCLAAHVPASCSSFFPVLLFVASPFVGLNCACAEDLLKSLAYCSSNFVTGSMSPI